MPSPSSSSSIYNSSYCYYLLCTGDNVRHTLHPACAQYTTVYGVCTLPDLPTPPSPSITILKTRSPFRVVFRGAVFCASVSFSTMALSMRQLMYSDERSLVFLFAAHDKSPAIFFITFFRAPITDIYWILQCVCG